MYSKHKLTLTGIATAIFHGYESRDEIIESNNYTLYNVYNNFKTLFFGITENIYLHQAWAKYISKYLSKVQVL